MGLEWKGLGFMMGNARVSSVLRNRERTCFSIPVPHKSTVQRMCHGLSKYGKRKNKIGYVVSMGIIAMAGGIG